MFSSSLNEAPDLRLRAACVFRCNPNGIINGFFAARVERYIDVPARERFDYCIVHVHNFVKISKPSACGQSSTDTSDFGKPFLPFFLRSFSTRTKPLSDNFTGCLDLDKRVTRGFHFIKINEVDSSTGQNCQQTNPWEYQQASLPQTSALRFAAQNTSPLQ